MGVASVNVNRVGPISRAEAEYIRDMQKAPTYWWGYEPRIQEANNHGGWYVMMYGERDATEAKRLLKARTAQ